MRRLSALLAVVLIAAAGCGDPPPTDRTADPYSEADLRYGLAPVPHPDVTFQPDVVIVGGGGGSVRSVTADGLTWTLDARAERAGELEPGKVMFVTGRGVGRVLRLERAGDDLLVTIGPVDLTEVIRDGTLARQGIPLDDVVSYPAGEPFWANLDDESGAPTPTTRFGPNRFLGQPTSSAQPAPPSEPGTPGDPKRAKFPARPPQPAPTRGGDGVKYNSGKYSSFATCCTDGVGAHFFYDSGGIKVGGTMLLTFKAPRADFYLTISGAKVTRAELVVSGGFGVKIDLEGGVDNGENIAEVLPIPADFSFPIAQVLGVPITFTISQAMAFRTAFGAKSGTIAGSGEFSLAGSLGYGYADGSFGPRVTTDVQRKESLINSIHGVPVGVMRLVVEHQVKFNVGFNAFVLQAGVYLKLTSKVGISMGSALGAPLAVCRGVGIGFDVVYGIGYSILAPVVREINRFLSLIDVKPIKAKGGIESKPTSLWSSQETIPKVALCEI